MDKVFAVIVTYNPEIPLLTDNINSLINQLDRVLVFDNASANIEEVERLLSNYDSIALYKNADNYGLPKNYNRAAEIAKAAGARWLLIMDQDTVVPDDLISIYSQYYNMEKVAIISPFIWDINVFSESEIKERLSSTPFNTIKKCISSASLNRIDVIEELGGFDEKLFIDMVDTDYCINVINHGYEILCINDAVVKHQVGNSRQGKFFWKNIIISNHAPFRIYYMFRNQVYCARKYKFNPIKHYRYYRDFLIMTVLILYDKEKRTDKLKMAFKGIKDGMVL